MSTNREQFLKKQGLPLDTSLSIPEISNLSGVPVRILNEVYKRGMGAYRGNLASVRLRDFSKNPDTRRFPAAARLSPQQWSFARVYSFVNRGTTFRTADADLARQLR
jgi:hypothetical protein